MSFVTEMADLARELLSAEGDLGGEAVVITRPNPAGTYNPATRRSVPGAPLVQTVRGTTDAELTKADLASGADALLARYERVLTAAPLLSGGFEPMAQDRVSAGGKSWQITETAHIIKDGVPILWLAGLETA